MKAAKENEAVTAEQWARESIRIARVTRELLKRFAAAYRLFQEFDELNSEMSRPLIQERIYMINKKIETYMICDIYVIYI